MTEKNHRRFSNFLINPRFQFKYALIIMAVGVIFTVAFAFAFREYVKVNYEVLTHTAVSEELGPLYFQELRSFTQSAVILSLAFLAVLVLWAFFVTHRTAGPMYHFKRVFNAIGSGAVNERIRLRPHDEFRDVAASFNRMMDELAKKAGSE